MQIVNGVEVIEGAYLLECNDEKKVTVYTDNHTVTRNETGHTLVMSAGANNKAFTLFTPAAADVGMIFTFANIGTGRLTIAVAGSGVQIDACTATTGTAYSDDDYIGNITLEIMSTTKWHIVSARGTWALS